MGALVKVIHTETGQDMGLYRAKGGPGRSIYLWPENGPEEPTQTLLWGDAR